MQRPDPAQRTHTSNESHRIDEIIIQLKGMKQWDDIQDKIYTMLTPQARRTYLEVYPIQG